MFLLVPFFVKNYKDQMNKLTQMIKCRFMTFHFSDGFSKTDGFLLYKLFPFLVAPFLVSQLTGLPVIPVSEMCNFSLTNMLVKHWTLKKVLVKHLINKYFGPLTKNSQILSETTFDYQILWSRIHFSIQYNLITTVGLTYFS